MSATADSKIKLEAEAVAEPSAAQKMIKVKTKDGDIFEIEEKVARLSKVVCDLLEAELGGSDDDVLPVPEVSTKLFRKILVWLRYHSENDKEEAPRSEEDEIIARFCEEIPEWDKKYLHVDHAVILEIMLAADYLDIKKLRGLCCKTIANILKSKSVEEIREMYGIVNDYTPEEEEEIRKQTAWCEDEPPKQGSNN